MPKAELSAVIEKATDLLDIDVPARDHAAAILVVVSKLQPYSEEDFSSLYSDWPHRASILRLPTLEALGFDFRREFSAVRVCGPIIDEENPSYLFTLFRNVTKRLTPMHMEGFVTVDEVPLARYSLARKVLDFQRSDLHRNLMISTTEEVIGETFLQQFP